MEFNEEYVKELKEYVNKNGSNGMKLRKFWIKHPQIREYINQLLIQYPNFKKTSNIQWCMLHDFNIEQYKCSMCGKQMLLKEATQMKQYCSIKCACNDPELKKRKKQTIAKDPDFYKKKQEKIKQTNLKKYGCIAPGQNEEIKAKIKATIQSDPDHWKKRSEKTKKTNLEKYGVENISQIKEIKDKKKQTTLKHFGVEVPAQCPQIQKKVEATCLKKYGVNCQFKRKEVRQYSWNQSWDSILSWKDYVIPLFTKEQYEGYNQNQEYLWKCTKCGNEFKQAIHHTKHLTISQMVPRCYNCYPLNPTGSAREKEVFYFIQSIYSGQIIQNDRTIINPKELDIVLPDLKLAVQYDGLYWHCTKHDRIDQNYHLNKTLACQKAGYRLIHIFQNEWLEKPEIIKAKLKSIICSNESSIYARKCIIKQIDTKTKNDFLNNNHIQGEDKSNIKLGLFYQNELIAVMTFCKSRFDKKHQWELSRYATSKRVIGGAGKLLSYFQKNYKPKNIVTYADRRYSIGNMYQKLGFKLDHISKPNYVWMKRRCDIKQGQLSKT